MTFLEIINKALIELNFKPITSLSSTKIDQVKLRNAINRVNKSIVLSNDFWFRQNKTTLVVDDSIEFANPATGKILFIKDNAIHYRYELDYTKIYDGTSAGLVYSFFGDKILFPSSDPSVTVDIYYLTDSPAVNASGVEISEMTTITDVSIIPDKYQETVLVNGACMQFKAMVTHPKYQHWKTEYIKAIAELRAECLNDSEERPSISIYNPVKTINEQSFGHIYG